MGEVYKNYVASTRTSLFGAKQKYKRINLVLYPNKTSLYILCCMAIIVCFYTLRLYYTIQVLEVQYKKYCLLQSLGTMGVWNEYNKEKTGKKSEKTMGFRNCKGITYTIKQGDNLYSISRRYNVPIAMLIRENPFVDVYNMQIGEEICIPVKDMVHDDRMIVYTVKDDETIRDVLNRFNIELDDLLKYNNLNTMKLLPGMTLQIPTQEYQSEQP